MFVFLSKVRWEVKIRYDFSSPSLHDATLKWLGGRRTLAIVREVKLEMAGYHRLYLVRMLNLASSKGHKGEGHYYSAKHHVVVKFRWNQSKKTRHSQRRSVRLPKSNSS